MLQIPADNSLVKLVKLLRMKRCEEIKFCNMPKKSGEKTSLSRYPSYEISSNPLALFYLAGGCCFRSPWTIYSVWFVRTKSHITTTTTSTTRTTNQTTTSHKHFISIQSNITKCISPFLDNFLLLERGFFSHRKASHVERVERFMVWRPANRAQANVGLLEQPIYWSFPFCPKICIPLASPGHVQPPWTSVDLLAG